MGCAFGLLRRRLGTEMQVLEVIAATQEAVLFVDRAASTETNNAQRLLFWMLNASQRDNGCVVRT